MSDRRFKIWLFVMMMAIAGLLSLLFIHPARAGGVICYEGPKALKLWRDKLGMSLQWQGQSWTGRKAFMLMNQSTGRWGFLVYLPENGSVCLIDEGNGSKPEFGQPT